MRENCWTCHRPKKICLCADIRPFPTRNRFLVLMHPMEARKEKMGTGRICLASLQNSICHVGVDFSSNQQLRQECLSPDYRTVLLYPCKESWNFTEDKDPRPLQIIVLDGTWPCAKKMAKLNPWLFDFPKISFTPQQSSAFVIKQQPHEMCLSTLEAIYTLLGELDQRGMENLEGRHEALWPPFKKMIDFQIACANDPSIPSYRHKGFVPPEQRTPSRKWEKRNIFHTLTET